MGQELMSSSNNENYSTTDEYEKKIEDLNLLLEKYKKKLCTQTKRTVAVEKNLTTVGADILQLRDIKIFKNPILKYQAYKKMLLTYNRLKTNTHSPKKVFLLPSDMPKLDPDKQFCISENEHPILIYQVGKVGSSAIHMAIKEHMKGFPVYQLHNIHKAQELLNKDVKENFKKKVHFMRGIGLKKKIIEEPNIQWKIIIGVREPISRWISDIFENIDTRYHFLKNSDDSVNVEKSIEFIKDSLDSEPQEKWFDDELLATFGVNVFEESFNGNYQIIQNEKINILIYRFENMQEYIPSVIKEFLDLKNFHLPTANATSQKSTAIAYKKVKEKLKFEVNFLNKFYSRRTVSHFYTSKEIEAFKKQWEAEYDDR